MNMSEFKPKVDSINYENSDEICALDSSLQ